jgi:SRSO17 transposase
MVEYKVGCCPGGAVVARQRTNQPSKNDPASRLLALPRRLAAFCSRVKFLFRTQTDDGSGHARVYVHGLMQAKPRAKNMERMEEAVAGADYEGLQHFIADSPWAAGPVMDHVTQGVSQLLDGPLALCYIDETAFSKKGEKSVGVARQYNGRLGKVDNCQVAVFAALGRGDRAALVGARLYLPEEWCSDAARCKAAGIPEEDRAFKSKAALAFELILHLREIGARFEASVLDAGYGKDPALLRALDVEGEVFVVDVHRSQRMWLTDPWPVVPEPVPGRRGRAPQAARAQGANLSVADWAAGQPEEAWRTTVLRQGTKGEIRVQFIHQRVYFWDGVEECAKLWHLVARRTLDIDGQPDAVSFTISNAAAEVPAARVVAMACARYFIERGFQDAKSHLGLADYQIRGWRAWHHHMALVMLAMLFHLRERLVHAEDYPLLSCADLIELLCYFLPKAAVTPEDVLRQMDQRHRKRQASIDSAYTRQAPWEEPPEEMR